MREVRCIVFDDREVFNAVVGLRRARRKPLPVGTVIAVALMEDDEVHAAFHMRDDNGAASALEVGEAEIAAACVHFLMERHVPIPSRMQKLLIVVDQQVGLVFHNIGAPPFRGGQRAPSSLADNDP